MNGGVVSLELKLVASVTMPSDSAEIAVPSERVYFTFWVLFKVRILFSNTGTTYGDLNSNETTFVDINSTSLLEVSTSLPETSTSLKEAITRSEGTAISAQSNVMLLLLRGGDAYIAHLRYW
jgi:hypothetical protein